MITVRRATLDDSFDVLIWRNDPLAITMSINQSSVSDEEHAKWFPQTLNSDQCVHLLGEVTDVDGGIRKIGVCRFDRKANNQWRISINLNPAFRGQGLSKPFLRQSIAFWADITKPQRVTLVAEVRETNVASVKIFERNGFKSVALSAGVLRMLREFG